TIDLSGAEKSHIDAPALEPVAEHFRHTDNEVGCVGKLSVSDRKRRPGWFRPYSSRFVHQHNVGRMKSARQASRHAGHSHTEEARCCWPQVPGGRKFLLP